LKEEFEAMINMVIKPSQGIDLPRRESVLVDVFELLWCWDDIKKKL